ncbi:MAG: tripartite tricarboxylate transporter TctB family protein [Hyphomicrobiaceae bacterium]
MSVRTAELLMAILMAAFSGYLMMKSAELPFGWIPDEGPGGGAWPFWLAAIMLICCIVMLVNWVRRSSAPSQSSEPFFPRGVLMDSGSVALALFLTIGLFDGLTLGGVPILPALGAYVAIFLFLVFYVGFLGRHGLAKTALFSIAVPVATFLFFEVALKIILPKGITEPFFLPIFKFFGLAGL